MSNLKELLAEARRHFEGGDLKRAESVLRLILQEAPDHAQTWYLLGATCQALGKLEEAEASLRQALQLQPHFAEAHNHLGVTLAQRKQIDKAIASFQKALELKPYLADAYHNLGLALVEKGMLAEAAVSFEHYLRHRPNSAQGHYHAGTCCGSWADWKRRWPATLRQSNFNPTSPMRMATWEWCSWINGDWRRLWAA